MTFEKMLYVCACVFVNFATFPVNLGNNWVIKCHLYRTDGRIPGEGYSEGAKGYCQGCCVACAVPDPVNTGS